MLTYLEKYDAVTLLFRYKGLPYIAYKLYVNEFYLSYHTFIAKSYTIQILRI